MSTTDCFLKSCCFVFVDYPKLVGEETIKRWSQVSDSVDKAWNFYIIEINDGQTVCFMFEFEVGLPFMSCFVLVLVMCYSRQASCISVSLLRAMEGQCYLSIT